MKTHARVLLLCLMLGLAGCATRIPVTVTKPAEVNMAGARRIAVLEFAVTRERVLDWDDVVDAALDKVFGVGIGEAAVERKMAEYVTERFILTLVRTSYFHVLGPGEVSDSVAAGAGGRGTASGRIGEATDAQAVLSGDIFHMEVKDEENVFTEEIYDPVAEEYREKSTVQITRSAELGVRYYVMDADTEEILLTRSFTDSVQTEESLEYEELLPDPIDMYREIVDSMMEQVARQLAPYTVRETRKLLRDGSDRMKKARRLAKSGLYERSLELYLQEWEETGDREAGYNAAILYEATGDLDAAVARMETVALRYPERKVLKAYERLIQARYEQQRLEEQFEFSE